MTDRKLEQYIREHSTDEDPVLEDLYRETHTRFVNPNMSSGFFLGRFIEMLSAMICPERILEIGTFTGYSAICLAKGLKGSGRLITIDINDELRDFAHSYFVRAGVADRIKQMTGNAVDIIPGLDEKFDLVFIDGDKREYCDYFRVVKSRLNTGAFILADNVLWGEKIFDEDTRDQQTRGIMEFNNMISSERDFENIIIPLRDGLSIIRKIR